MHNGNEPFPVLTSPPMMKRILVIGEGQELHRVNLSLTMKNATTSEGTKAYLIKAWEMML